ncbi:hypothetical protein MXB_1029, partial [Myxobolus squamalis]
NAVTLCDSGAFTIPTKRKVADKVYQQRSDQSKVDFLGLESLENSTVDGMGKSLTKTIKFRYGLLMMYCVCYAQTIRV